MAVPVLCPGLAHFIAGYPYVPHSNRRSWLREFHRFRHRKVGKLFFVTFRPYKIACFLPTEVCLSIRVCVGQLWRRRSLALAHTRTNALSLSLPLCGSTTRALAVQTRLVNGVLASILFLQLLLHAAFHLGGTANPRRWGQLAIGGLWGIGTARFYL